MCYSREYYNWLKRKQYEEYLKRSKKYYSYKKKYCEGYPNTTTKEQLFKETKHKPIKEICKKNYYNKQCNTTDKNQKNKCSIDNCKAKFSSETLPLCENIPHTSDVTTGPITVRIPVVLTECNIIITVQSSIKLEDIVLEIKHIKKNVFLNQCKLIPNSEDDKPNTGILFLAGFIRKNIEYFAKEHNDKGVLYGKLKHATVDVPFKCTTKVTFKTPPKFKATTYEDEVEILQTNIDVCNPCEEGIAGRDTREQNFRLIEFFNEKVFCELISAEFVESDIFKNSTNKECNLSHEQTVHDITEKLALFLTIKLLQNQNVVIPK